MTSVFSYIDIVVFTLSSFYFLLSFFGFFFFVFVCQGFCLLAQSRGGE